MAEDHKYSEYFDVDESYWPCIDDSAINAGAPWETTYPHETFIKMLEDVDKMLGGTTKRSLWIHGAYGTGKSQCAYALRKILEVPKEEVEAYWDRYEPLKKKTVLRDKLLGHKENGVVTAWRYASGSITNPQQLFMAVQESVREALDQIPGSYKGENTLKENVIAWMEDSAHKGFVNDLLMKPEWMAEFSQSTADEIINTLKKSTEISGLMDSIFKMAAKEGVTALSLTAESLRKWIIDVISQNHTKIVLIWDEFSGFFRQNRNSLDEFQKVVSLCEETHFYFIIVTHPFSSIAGAASVSKDDPMSVVLQRFNRVEITLPPNIAFELTGHAFSVIPAARKDWESMTGYLNASVPNASKAVMKASEVNDPNVMRNMLPIHPMAALVLKNIASSFQSNQRSMFDFIKTPKDMDAKAFQWFIQNSGPHSDRPLLTVDMLWDFFYEKGKDYLSSDIRLVLDAFGQQSGLVEKEEIVLKTILIMQAVDQQLSMSIPLLKPTNQNLSYAFEGDNEEYASSCKNIAKALVNKGILITTPVGNGESAYAVAVLAGDGAKIDAHRKELRKKDIGKILDDGPEIATALSLPPALKLRYAMHEDIGDLPVVTVLNFAKTMDSLKHKDVNWSFCAVLAVAKNDDEAMGFRTMIKQAIGKKEYENIAVIDALSTPLGLEEFDRYVEYSAMSLYYQGNNNQQSRDNSHKATEVLNRAWKDRIHNGAFIVWTYQNQSGEKATGAEAVHTILQTIVLNRFPYTFDFNKGLSESQLKLTQPKPASRCGLTGEMKGLIAGCEKSVLGKVWNHEAYWEDPALENEPISKIKADVDRLIAEEFGKSGRISTEDIYDLLVSKYGLSSCNLTAFIFGFLLREYSDEPYRCQDSEGHRESMTPDKLSEMIGNCMVGKKGSTYIVSLTESERAFYQMTEGAWGLDPDSCTSPTQAGTLIQGKMRDLGYPVWCLEEVDDTGVFDIVKMYISLVQGNGVNAHDIANDLGNIALQRPNCTQNLKNLLTKENCQTGMRLFLNYFEDGKLVRLADEIGASGHMMNDIRNLFQVPHSAQWNRETGEDEIRKLITEYEVIKATNLLLNVSDNTKEACFKSWRDALNFIGFSCESVCAKMPSLKKVFNLLFKIAGYEEMRPDMMQSLLSELNTHNAELHDILQDPLHVFMELYAPYLEGFSTEECDAIKADIHVDMFTLTATKSNAEVKQAAENHRKNQVKSQLYQLWKDKTGGTKNPKQWSDKYETPILCCMDGSVYNEAKTAFAVLNSSNPTETEIKSALSFLQKADFFERINDSAYRDKCFMESIVGDYAGLLPQADSVRSELRNLPINVYDWVGDPNVQNKIKNMASAEYNAGGSDVVKELIDGMDKEQLKDWLKDMVGKDMELGIRILSNGGESS